MTGTEKIKDDNGIPVCGCERVDLIAVEGKVNQYICPMFELSEGGLPLCRKQDGRACLLNSGEVVIISPSKLV